MIFIVIRESRSVSNYAKKRRKFDYFQRTHPLITPHDEKISEMVCKRDQSNRTLSFSCRSLKRKNLIQIYCLKMLSTFLCETTLYWHGNSTIQHTRRSRIEMKTWMFLMCLYIHTLFFSLSLFSKENLTVIYRILVTNHLWIISCEKGPSKVFHWLTFSTNENAMSCKGIK